MKINLLVRLVILGAMVSFKPASSVALDSRDLAKQRSEMYAGLPFYCPIGREPIANSLFAWSVQASPSCRFNGPIDTVVDRRRLEPPFLNPKLTISELQLALTHAGLRIDGVEGERLRFRLPTGEVLYADRVAFQDLKDTLMKLNGYPATWARDFLTIHADTAAAVESFMALATTWPESVTSGLFWVNPHWQAEQEVRPKLSGARVYQPLPLLSRCGGGRDWREFSPGARSLLIIGDLHSAKELDFFQVVLAAREFAWVGLEISRDRDDDWRAFLAAKSTEDEEAPLAAMVARKSRDTIVATKAMLRQLKALRTNVVLVDYTESYFNFPYTDTSFYGLVVAARNRLWTERLPADWQGTGVLFAGVDHFLVTPGADFQDFAKDRFGDLPMGLVNPLESCAP